MADFSQQSGDEAKAGPADEAPDSDKAGTGADGNNPDNKKKKKKDELECGENGKFGELKKKTGKGQFDRDHVPSKAALKEYARLELRGGKALCKAQKKAIDKVGEAIAIPKWLHQKFSPTYGGRNSDSRITGDAGNLEAAAKRDTEEVQKGLNDKTISEECRKKYQAWAEKVNNTTNAQYKEMLSKAIGK